MSESTYPGMYSNYPTDSVFSKSSLANAVVSTAMRQFPREDEFLEDVYHLGNVSQVLDVDYVRDVGSVFKISVVLREGSDIEIVVKESPLPIPIYLPYIQFGHLSYLSNDIFSTLSIRRDILKYLKDPKSSQSNYGKLGILHRTSCSGEVLVPLGFIVEGKPGKTKLNSLEEQYIKDTLSNIVRLLEE